VLNVGLTPFLSQPLREAELAKALAPLKETLATLSQAAPATPAGGQAPSVGDPNAPLFDESLLCDFDGPLR
jgi:hypothetical protein